MNTPVKVIATRIDKNRGTFVSQEEQFLKKVKMQKLASFKKYKRGRYSRRRDC